MQSFGAFLRRHPALSYFILTFLVSWGGAILLGAPYGMPTTSEEFARVWPVVLLPYFLGPALAGLLMTAIVWGRAGFRTLFSRLGKWRVGMSWWGIALLTAPLVVTILLSILSLASKDYLPAIATAQDKLGTIVMGLTVGLIFGGFLEELGWTGFAVPALRQSRNILSSGLIVGILWAIWHIFPTFWGGGDETGKLNLTNFIPPLFFYAGVLTSFRILMVWVYDNTESLLLAMLMHASLTSSTLFILAPGAQGTALIIYYLILTPVMWGIVALAVLRKPAQARTRPSGKMPAA